MCKAGHMCTALSSHVFHISAPLSDTANTSQGLRKPAPALLPRRATALSLPLHPGMCWRSEHSKYQLRFVVRAPTQNQNTERMSTSQALYLCPLCTSPLSLDLHFPVDIPAPRMVCGDADKLLKGNWTVTEIVPIIHCAS